MIGEVGFVHSPVGIEEHSYALFRIPRNLHLSADCPENGVHAIESDASLGIRDDQSNSKPALQGYLSQYAEQMALSCPVVRVD